jgi:hypothetical protein
MTKAESSKNFLQLAVAEAQSYLTIDQIDHALENNSKLAGLPLQPLYLAYSILPIEKKTALLPSLTTEQRQLFLDIDLWRKDEIDVDNFLPWVSIYAACGNEKLQYEFTKSSEFALFFKGRFNVWTFDVEDPLYPEHNNYFLTDDSLLLIEYDEDFSFVDELKLLIKNLYTEEGVENAYTYIFKLVADQMSSMSEDEYRWKKHRLEDKGIVDYFEALEKLNRFPSIKHIINFIRLAKPATGKLEEDSINQVPHFNFLAPISKVSEDLQVELSKVTDQSRIDFLKFNLVKLVNADIEISGGLSLGTIALSKGSRRVKNFIQLGYEFSLSEWKELDREGHFFDYFTMTDLYRFGKSLIEIEQEKLNKKYTELNLDESFDTFLGHWAQTFIAQAFDKETVEDFTGKTLSLEKTKDYYRFEKLVDLITTMTPFAKALQERFQELKSSGQLKNDFYLNYDLESIDFNALLLSNFAQHCLKLNDKSGAPKLALTLDEYKQFVDWYNDKNLTPNIKSFIKSFGLEKVTLIEEYIEYLLKECFDGIIIKDLTDEEFKHMGGPIILNL